LFDWYGDTIFSVAWRLTQKCSRILLNLPGK
jgi:hypothetical protein